MRAALVTHSSSLGHVAPWDHPERPERIAAAVEGARASRVEIVEVEARAATRAELLAVHNESYLERVQRVAVEAPWTRTRTSRQLRGPRLSTPRVPD